ncbi:MAG: TIR domain-containing protein [Deltaproteobacteria bacterium]|nr:TIR domain-containing protein [Deltaproteobacteria bacterium]
MPTRHTVFISYHHENDESRRKIFELRFGNAYGVIIPTPVGLGDIPAGLSAETVRQKIRDEYLRDPSVTVVLVGTETWSRKHVDWEIGSTLRDTERNPRGGLLGVLLPTYVEENRHQFDSASEEGTEYYQYTLPPRLAQNVQRGYAPLIRWTDSPEEIAGWVHETYRRKRRIQPDNTYPSFVNNRGGKRWYP